MSPNDANAVTVHNLRPPRWPAAVVLIFTVSFFMWIAAAFQMGRSLALTVVFVVGGAVSLACGVGVSLFARRPIWSIKLGDRLISRPSGAETRPLEINLIEFDHDPHEDYDDNPSPVPVCSIRIAADDKADIVMTASMAEAVRLRDWAVRVGVRVVDPTEYLTRHGPAAGARANPAE